MRCIAAAGTRALRRALRSTAGLTLLELIIVVVIMAIGLSLSYTRWVGYQNRQRLRYGTAQVATDLREGQERARAERRTYTVTLTGGSQNYTIVGGTFAENAQLPVGVTPAANTTVGFSAYGKPNNNYSITIQNSTGSGTVTVTRAGGVTYQAP